jgi:hypothetical protein
MGYNTASLQRSLQKGPTPPLVATGTQIPLQPLAKPFCLARLLKGFVPPSTPNPKTHNLAPSTPKRHPASTISGRAFAGHNTDLLLGSLKKGPIPPSVPNGRTHLPGPPLTISQKSFASHFTGHLLESLDKGPTPPSQGNGGTNIPNPTSNQPKGFSKSP